jgi:hypothetical protein
VALTYSFLNEFGDGGLIYFLLFIGRAEGGWRWDKVDDWREEGGGSKGN